MILTSALLLISLFTQSQLYTFQNFNHRAGLRMASTSTIVQTQDGAIWIGTDGSEIYTYDGKTFEEIRSDHQDNNHHITHFWIDHRRILFSSRFKGFFAYDLEAKKFEQLNNNNLPYGEALAVVKSDSSIICIGSRSVFSIDSKGNCTVLHSLNSTENDLKITQIIPVKNTLFLLTEQGGFQLKGKQLVSLKKWIGFPVRDLNTFKFGYYDDGWLTLINQKADRWLRFDIDKKGNFSSFQDDKTPPLFSENEFSISYSYNPISRQGGFLTNKNKLYRQKEKDVTLIIHNSNQPIEGCREIFTDLHGDFWLTSRIKGVYKVSREPFTKVELSPIYEYPDIAFPYKTMYSDVFIGRFSGITYQGSTLEDRPIIEHPFATHAMEEIDGVYYLATNTGVRRYHPEKYPTCEVVYFQNQNITSLFASHPILWIGVAGKGLHRINTKTGEIVPIRSNKLNVPEYIYTAQISSDMKTVYFGTNHGVFQLPVGSTKIERLDLPEDLGFYSGVSTKDRYGTCWFSMEKGLVGITPKQKVVTLSGSNYFESNLFYTLNSDSFGNLMVGTNKGLTILKVDADGQVLSKRVYNETSGFLGYETNMRSQFQTEDNEIILGTVEGLFMVDTRLLSESNRILAPSVSRGYNNENTEPNYSGTYIFNFKINNPKAGKISYACKIDKRNKEWKLLEPGKHSIRIDDLSDGKYTLLVKAKYEGGAYGDVTAYPFSVHIPLWKTNWFILVLTIAVIAANLLFLRYYNAREAGKLISTKDVTVHLKYTPYVLLFAVVFAPLSQILAPLFVPELQLKLGQSLTMGFLLLVLLMLSLNAKSTKREHLYDRYLKLGFIIVIANFMWEVYSSDLHPFNIIGVVLVSTMAPYVFLKVRPTVVYAVIILSVSIAFVGILDATVYPKLYFLIAMIVMIGLTIISSFLRFDSLEKLLFISAIINRGNVPAIAFNRDGTVTYASENIANFAAITHDQILGQNISILNHFIPFGEEYKKRDVTKEFIDSETYLVPMENPSGEVRWIEWNYKDFSANVKVILGHDVTEKLEVQNTYELLVENAEDFIFQCDAQGKFIFLNDVCYTKLGYTKQALIGNDFSTLLPPRHRKKVMDFIEDHFQQKRSNSYLEFPFLKSNGKIIWVGQHFTTLHIPGNQTQNKGFIAVARDITEFRKQQKVILEQKDAITDSINYARRIQYNLLPNKAQFASQFNEHFILYKPKDIVSGDFYWMQKVGDKSVLALADCTGHGVPGSFMTLLGFNLLNSIVLENKITDPGDALNELDKKLIQYLPKGDGNNLVNDGMEITLCVFDHKSNQLAYACAGSRFLVYEQNSFTMFKGDNKHIGDVEANFNQYSTHYTEFQDDYQLFLFSDGFQDQFGGPKDKKYSFRRLLELLEANINLPLAEQLKMIESDLVQWVGSNAQTDDITMISVKKT